MSDTPELGQMCFGNPFGPYGTDDFVDALVDYILAEIDRVYWNNNQKEWNKYDDPKIPGLEYRPYYWGDDEIESEKPNLKFAHSFQEIRWYKHPGRGQSCKLNWEANLWREWVNKSIQVIRDSEHDIYESPKEASTNLTTKEEEK